MVELISPRRTVPLWLLPSHPFSVYHSEKCRPHTSHGLHRLCLHVIQEHTKNTTAKSAFVFFARAGHQSAQARPKARPQRESLHCARLLGLFVQMKRSITSPPQSSLKRRIVGNSGDPPMSPGLPQPKTTWDCTPQHTPTPLSRTNSLNGAWHIRSSEQDKFTALSTYKRQHGSIVANVLCFSLQILECATRGSIRQTPPGPERDFIGPDSGALEDELQAIYSGPWIGASCRLLHQGLGSRVDGGGSHSGCGRVGRGSRLHSGRPQGARSTETGGFAWDCRGGIMWARAWSHAAAPGPSPGSGGPELPTAALRARCPSRLRHPPMLPWGVRGIWCPPVHKALGRQSLDPEEPIPPFWGEPCCKNSSRIATCTNMAREQHGPTPVQHFHAGYTQRSWMLAVGCNPNRGCTRLRSGDTRPHTDALHYTPTGFLPPGLAPPTAFLAAR